VPKFPWPPPADALRRVPPAVRTLRSGTRIARIYTRGGRYPAAWHDFRFDGPLSGGRFDPHTQGAVRGVLYGAVMLTTCVAEVFQHTRVVDRFADQRCLAAFAIIRSVRLLDLTGAWPTRAGASQALATGPRARAQAWTGAVYDAYPAVEGVWYPSSMHGGHQALALFERAADALPGRPDIDLPLSHDGLLPDLVRAADTLGYLLA
jgi:RES domain-containing protein